MFVDTITDTVLYKLLAGFGFGGLVAFFNFWVLKRGMLLLADFRKTNALFLLFLFLRYAFLACGIFILFKWKALDWRGGLVGLLGVYAALLIVEAIKLRSTALKGE